MYLCRKVIQRFLPDMNITLQSDFILPPEWYPQSGMMLTWPHEGTDWKPYLKEISQTYLELTKEITAREKLIVVTPHVEDTKKQIEDFIGKPQMKNIKFFDIDTNDTWARDHGPITLVSTGKAKGFYIHKHLLDFNFNGWGEKFSYELDNAINLKLYYAGAFQAALENHTDFTLEGGSIESDGKGTIFTTTSCLLAPNRNQPLQKEDIDARLKIIFHVPRVVWLDHGLLAGDDTDGHIDTIVRIAPDDTLLYMGFDDPKDEHYHDFVALEEQLKVLRTLDGRPYKLLRLSAPDAIYDGEDRLPATYANFVILNGAVLVPTYHQPQKDKAAIDTIREAFPGREIIGIDSRTVIRQHGSLHCLTMQFPKDLLTTSYSMEKSDIWTI